MNIFLLLTDAAEPVAETAGTSGELLLNYLIYAVIIVVGILMDPLGDHSVWQPLCAVVLMLALDKYEKTHGEIK